MLFSNTSAQKHTMNLATDDVSLRLCLMQGAEGIRCSCACRDLSMPKFQWDHPMLSNGAQVPFSSREIDRTVSVSSDPYKVCTRAVQCAFMGICQKTTSEHTRDNLQCISAHRCTVFKYGNSHSCVIMCLFFENQRFPHKLRQTSGAC